MACLKDEAEDATDLQSAAKNKDNTKIKINKSVAEIFTTFPGFLLWFKVFPVYSEKNVFFHIEIDCGKTFQSTQLIWKYMYMYMELFRGRSSGRLMCDQFHDD